MIVLISPAKQMDFKQILPDHFIRISNQYNRLPRFSSSALKLASVLELLTPKEMEALMDVSPSLAEQTVEKYRYFASFCESRPAVAAYAGMVFKAIDSISISEEGLIFAQKTLRILSGMYGVLNPFDRIAPYRLEVKTPLSVNGFKNLYDFWESSMAEVFSTIEEPVLNLASGEYAAMVKKCVEKDTLITVNFKELSKGKLRTVGTYAKAARGLMVRMILEEQISAPDLLKSLKVGDYCFSEEHSEGHNWVFIRNH